MEINYESIENLIKNKPYIAIDYLLYELTKCKETETKSLTDLFIKAILAYLKKSYSYNYQNGIFNKNFTYDERHFIAICLIRLLSINDDLFESTHEFRVKSCSLFDDVLSKDLYERIGITVRQQNFEKMMKLKEVAPKAEQMVQELVDSLISLERLDHFHNQLMKILNSPLVKSIIVPFLPYTLIDKYKIREIFDNFESYKKSTTLTIIESYEKINNTLETYLLEAQKHNSYYCKHYLIIIFQKLLSLLNDDFINSEIGQPADLLIYPLDKKYPLSHLGQSIDLGFIIENKGAGHAFDVELNVYSVYDNIKFLKNNMLLGYIEPGTLIMDFQIIINSPEDIAFVEIDIKWYNADRSEHHFKNMFELEGQRIDIPWEELIFEDPYSLEPVEDFNDLVGRRETINQLIRQSCAKKIGSSYLYGQKRVGKTSIVKALNSKLNQKPAFLSIYLEGGEYVHPNPELTLSQLGIKLCEKVKETDKCFLGLTIPKFEGSLSPLSDFLDYVHDLKPELHIIFILDEFDELPIDLYKRGPIADAFFLTIRTISGKAPFGFILVGGEKMEFILSIQGDVLNKFQTISVDYFDREKNWSDYLDLVRRPTKKWFDISDEAIIDLYRQTNGNPFYTMFICRELFIMMVDRRDNNITRREMKNAIDNALKKIHSNGFQHFWEDGIFESKGDKVEEISIRRRRFLIAFANILRVNSKISKENIEKEELLISEIDFIESELRRFVQRNILIHENNLYDCKVPFFKTWLINYGVKEILTTFSDLDAILERKKSEEDAYVRSDEIITLSLKWDLYQGRRISEDQIRSWLGQFGSYINQRLMFKILQNVIFYSNDLIRSKMKESHGIVRRGIIRKIEEGKRKRSDIIICYLDSLGKSGGGKYAKLYADENEIYYKNVVERGKLSEIITNNKEIQALVFIDDFIGTGNSTISYLSNLENECGNILRKFNLKIFFIAITGFQESQHAIEEVLVNLNLPIKIHICDPIDASFKCFSDNSTILPDASERLQALHIAEEFGNKLVKQNPLGYGNCQTVIIFPDNCPNNNLPILWAESKNPLWRPLFKRPLSK